MTEGKQAPRIARGNTNIAIKAGFWYVISTFLAKGLSFITTPIFARIMTEADYGEFSNYANWQSILIIIISAEMYNTLSRAYYDYADEYDQYTSSITIASLGIAVIFYIFFLICYDWIFSVVSIPAEYIHILFFTIMFQSCKQIYLAKERTLYRYRSVAVLSVLSLAVPTIISVALVVLVEDAYQLTARIYGFYVPYALLGVYCAVVLWLKGKTFKWSHVRYAVVLALPLLAHYFTAYMLTSTNTIITKSMGGAEVAAVVSIAASVMQILTMLFQAVTGALTTWVMDNINQKHFEKVKKCSIIFSAAISFISIGVTLLGPELVWIIGGENYSESANLIPAWAFSIFIQTITTLFTIILTYDKNVVNTAIITAIVAVVSIFAKISLFSELGYEIFPIINSIAFLLLFIANYIFVNKAGYAANINIKIITIIILFTAFVVFAIFKIYDYAFIRYILTLLLGIVFIIIIYKNKNALLRFMKKEKS